MYQLKQSVRYLATAGASLALACGVHASGQETSNYRLMTESEIAAHTATMQVLQGAARDAYRDEQYEHLRQRAREHGFLMPEVPPWKGQTTARAAQAPGESGQEQQAGPAIEAADRHAAMRGKLEARREGIRQAAESSRGETPVGAPAAQVAAPAADVTESQSQASAPYAGLLTGGKTPAGEASRAMALDPPTQLPAGPESDAPAAKPAGPGAATSDESGKVAGAGNAETVLDEAHAVPGTEKTAVQPPVAPPPPIPPSPPPAQQRAPAADLAVRGVPDANAPPAGVPGAANPSTEAMSAYREAMRARFDEYMQERQAQLEESVRLQREQHEAATGRSRTEAPRPPIQPYPYPAMPPYGPRYPAAYPGYGTPYWQQR